MTIYNDRIVIVFPIPERNGKPARPADASFQTLEVSDSGNEFINVVPLNPQAIGQYAEQFSLAVIAERDALKPIADLSEQRAARIAELEAELDAIRNPPGPDLSTVEGVKQLLSQVRYEREVLGFTVGDQFVSTNRDELAHWFARFFDAFNFLQGVPSASNGQYPYKPRGGSVVTILTAQQAVRAYQCLAWYVNACIATEGELIAAIDAGQLTLQQAVAAINNEGTWPQRQFAWNPN